MQKLEDPVLHANVITTAGGIIGRESAGNPEEVKVSYSKK